MLTRERPASLPYTAPTIRGQIGRTMSTFETWLLALLCAVLMFGPLAFGAVQEWSLFAVEIGAVLLAALWAGRQLATGTIEFQKNPIFLPAILFAAVVIAQLVFSTTVYRYATVHDGLRYFSCALLIFVAAQAVHTSSSLRAFAIAMSVFGTAVAIFAIVQEFTWNGKLYWFYPLTVPPTTPIYGPYVSHNSYAGLMELLVPLAFGLAARRSWPTTPRLLAALAGVVMAGSVVMSMSRGGTVALLVELLFFAAVASWWERSSRILLSFVVGVALIAGFVWYFGSDAVWHHLETIEHASNEPNLQMRVAITQDTVRMFKARPWLGWGLRSFPSVYPQFQSFPEYRVINEAHDDYAQLLAETGLVGFGVMLLFVVALYRSAFRRLGGHRKDYVRLGALAGCTGILVHSAVDFNLQIPANAALFFVLATIAAATPGNSARSGRGGSDYELC